MDKDTIIARWIAGQISDTDFKKQVSDDDYAAYIKLRKALQLYEHTQSEVPDAVYQNIKTQISKAKHSSRQFNLYKLAIPVAAVLLLFFAVNYFLSPAMFSVKTAYGETKKTVLPDGSVAWLGPHSTLSYDKDGWDANREVKLTGSAYFEVKKGRRFRVITSNGKVSVLGTKFEVKSIADLFKTVCFEGKVMVQTLQKNVILEAGQSVQQYDHQFRKQAISYNQPDIRSQTTRFAQTPLKYVLQDIENQYNVKFVNKGVNPMILFTGTIPRTDLKLSLDLVSKALKIKYKQRDGHTIIIKP